MTETSQSAERTSTRPGVFPITQSLTTGQQILRPKPQDVDLVLYHGRCPDGSCSRWAAERLLRDRAEYVAAFHYCDLPDVTGRNVAILDFAIHRPKLLRFIEKAKSVIVLDHHVSSVAEIGDLDCVVIGKHGIESGASLSWKFFQQEPIPFIVDHIRMGDTYRWPSEEIRKVSTEFLTWFNEQPYTPDLYEEFVSPETPSRFSTLCEIGQYLRQHDMMAIERAASNAVSITVQGRPAYIANCSYLRGEVAAYFYEKMGAEVGVTYCYDELRDTTAFSLRAAPESTIDLTKTVMQVPGGGGHATACGFSLPGPYDPKRVRQILEARFDD